MDKEVGKRIKSVREKTGLSQKDFGLRLGVSLPTISRVEKGHRLPDVQLVINMTEQFGCDLNWLLIGEGGLAGSGSSKVPILKVVSSSMGSVAGDEVEGFLSIPGVQEGLFAFSWRGEEMMPVIRSGDFVLFRPGEVRAGSLVVAVDGWGNPLVRRLGEVGGVSVLSAEDTGYPDISGTDAEIVGPVVEIVRRTIL